MKLIVLFNVTQEFIILYLIIPNNMAAAKIKIELENGKTYNLSESVSYGDESHSKNYGLLEEALNHLQKQTNSILTDVVEEEKSKLNSDSKNSTLQGKQN